MRAGRTRRRTFEEKGWLINGSWIGLFCLRPGVLRVSLSPTCEHSDRRGLCIRPPPEDTPEDAGQAQAGDSALVFDFVEAVS